MAGFIITDSASILNRLDDVGGLDFFRAGEAGDAAADFEHAAYISQVQKSRIDSRVHARNAPRRDAKEC